MKQYLAFAYNAFTLLGICDSKICIKKTVFFFLRANYLLSKSFHKWSQYKGKLDPNLYSKH